MTLDDLSISEQHEYDIYADSLVYDREYQVACQYCKATAKGTWEQLERVEGWILAKRETCPKCAAEPEAEAEPESPATECENCGIDTYLVGGRLCEWCDEQAVASVMPYTAAMAMGRMR